METQSLIAEAVALPVEERAIVVESILKSLNPSESLVEQKWITLAKERLSDLQARNIEAVQGDEVFGKIWKRLSS